MESAPGITPDRVCSQCGLTVGQRGSFTYWIFKDNRCQCDDTTHARSISAGQPGASVGGGARPAEQKGAEKLILNQRYELLQRVGQGGIGFVYKGRDVTNGNIVALKIMRPELARNELATKRVMREVEVVSRLSNANLGNVYGYGQEQDGAPYLVMEFIEGRNMEDLLQAEGKLKIGRAMEIFTQICCGLIGAHSNGIIHRDLKPSNVIINQVESGQDHATIVDFGFARLLREANDSLKLTQEGEVFGSPAYMSPEQCLGEELDVRSDIYSFGCLMYETLTGVAPLLGENVLATVAKQIRSTPSSMHSRDAAIPEDLDAIVLKCLSKEPLHRYQSVTDLRQDLEKVKRGGHIKATVKRAPSKDQNGERSSLRSTENAYGKMTSMVAIVLIAAIAIGIGTAGAFYIFLTKQGNSNAMTPPATPATAAQSAGQSANAGDASTPPVLTPPVATERNQVAAPPQKSSHQNTDARHTTASPPRHAPRTRAPQKNLTQSKSGGWDELKGLRVYK
ncbi:hypothetical protein BH10CYA1_BH10CYA1_34620 [soil metagenome]